MTDQPPITDPAAAEATGAETVTFDFDGIAITIPASMNQVDINVVDHFLDGERLTGVRALLGPDQWATLKSAHLTYAQLLELGDRIGEHWGFQSVGESPASSD